MPGEDGIGLGRAELASFVGVTGLQQNWVPLRTPWNFEASGDVELLTGVLELADLLVGGENTALTVDDRTIDAPAVPQRPYCVDQLVGACIPLGMLQIATAAEVLAGEGVRGGDQVPGGAAVGEMIERRELLGQLVRFVERGVDRPGQAEMRCHTGNRIENAEGVRATDYVEVVNFALMLA